MKLAGRAAAAIAILNAIISHHRPASEALRDWGKAHRFAGSSDRHVIGTLVYDALRNKNSAAARLGSDTPRALILGTLATIWALSGEAIAALASDQFGPGSLSAAARSALAAPLTDMPDHIAGNFPLWLAPQLHAAFSSDTVAEMRALCQRAPIDLRINTLKTSREAMLAVLAKFAPFPTPFSPWGIRIAAPGFEARNINVEVEPAHGLGQFEVQDEASQLAAFLAAPKADECVLDLCAGAGGKTLALAALMQNRGRLIAHDRDKHRLRPIFERISRSGASCIEVIAADDSARLQQDGGYDLIVVDAPCTGSGTWRRKPDAKWRLSERQLQLRLNEQTRVLDQAAPLLCKGGRLAYFTCSILPAENQAQVAGFLQRHRDFKIIPFTEQWARVLDAPPPAGGDMLQLTPRQHGTDGFFVAILSRVS